MALPPLESRRTPATAHRPTHRACSWRIGLLVGLLGLGGIAWAGDPPSVDLTQVHRGAPHHAPGSPEAEGAPAWTKDGEDVYRVVIFHEHRVVGRMRLVAPIGAEAAVVANNQPTGAPLQEMFAHLETSDDPQNPGAALVALTGGVNGVDDPSHPLTLTFAQTVSLVPHGNTLIALPMTFMTEGTFVVLVRGPFDTP